MSYLDSNLAAAAVDCLKGFDVVAKLQLGELADLCNFG